MSLRVRTSRANLPYLLLTNNALNQPWYSRYIYRLYRNRILCFLREHKSNEVSYIYHRSPTSKTKFLLVYVFLFVNYRAWSTSLHISLPFKMDPQAYAEKLLCLSAHAPAIGLSHQEHLHFLSIYHRQTVRKFPLLYILSIAFLGFYAVSVLFLYFLSNYLPAYALQYYASGNLW